MSEPVRHSVAKANPDVEAFTSIYLEYSTRIFTYLQYRLDDSDTAQDLTAKVFEQVLSSLHRYDAERAPLAVWLFAIARHVVTDWQRRAYLRKLLPWEDFSRKPSADPGPEQAIQESEERRNLRKALARLSNRERDLIGLRFSGGMTNRKIAELTGLSASNVAVILYRALGKLRLYLAEPAEFPCPNATQNTLVDTRKMGTKKVDHETR